MSAGGVQPGRARETEIGSRASYNALSYFVTLFYQQIRGDDPVHTSLETLPFAIMAFVVNVLAGWLLGTVRGDVLIGVGLLGTLVRLRLPPLHHPLPMHWQYIISILILTTPPPYMHRRPPR